MKIHIDCPFEEKDYAKGLGAIWDPEERCWFIPYRSDYSLFKRWMNSRSYKEIEQCDLYFSKRIFNEDEYIRPELEPIEFKKIGLTDFVIIDTETTGSTKNDEVVELSVLSKDGDELYHSFFSPTVQINPFASDITDIYNEDLIGMPYFADEWENIKKAVDRRPIICHNTPFDRAMIAQTLYRYGINKQECYDLFESSYDSVKIAKKFIQSDSYKLSKLCELIGVKETQHHRATYDCLFVLLLLREIELGKY